jgi:hypothetical protein
MEQATEHPFDTTVKVMPGQAKIWAPAGQPLRKIEANHPGSIGYVPSNDSQQSIGKIHACRISQRGFQQAQDRLKRANRDLAETAGFMLALVTTVTAIEAVINIADNKIHASSEFLRMAFDIYIGLFVLILILGGLRGWGAIRRRSQAEREVDQAKQGIFEFCPGDQWPKAEE